MAGKSRSPSLDLCEVVADIKNAVVEGDIEIEDVLFHLDFLESWADGYATSKRYAVED